MSKELVCSIELIVPGSAEKLYFEKSSNFDTAEYHTVFMELKKYYAPPWFITAHNGHRPFYRRT